MRASIPQYVVATLPHYPYYKDSCLADSYCGRTVVWCLDVVGLVVMGCDFQKKKGGTIISNCNGQCPLVISWHMFVIIKRSASDHQHKIKLLLDH